MIFAESCKGMKLNGLQDENNNLRRKRFGNDHRRQEAEGQPRGPLKRSIPNRMKRFLAELHGDNYMLLPTENDNDGASKTNTDSTIIGTFSSAASRRSMVKVDDFGEDASSKAVRSLVRHGKPKKKGQNCNIPMENSHVRCEKCDYPYDSSKRRGPPHCYTPTVVTLPLRTGRLSSADDASKKPSTTYLNLHGIKDAKIQRLKRRRSSTELYKNMVSVSFPSM